MHSHRDNLRRRGNQAQRDREASGNIPGVVVIFFVLFAMGFFCNSAHPVAGDQLVDFIFLGGGQ